MSMNVSPVFEWYSSSEFESYSVYKRYMKLADSIFMLAISVLIGTVHVS